MSTFFADNPDQQFLLLQHLLGCIHSYSSPHSSWTSPRIDWKTRFVKLHPETIIGAKFDDMSTFFVDNPDQYFFLFQKLLGCIYSYSSLHYIWTSPWLDWKTLFVKLHTDTLLSAKFDNMGTFFVHNPDQYFLLFQHLLGCIHSYSSPHSIWTSASLDRKTLFVKLHTDAVLSAKFDNDISTFFVDNTDQKMFLFQHLLGCIHSYSSPHSIWTSPWLGWKTLFVKLHTDTLLSAKFYNDMSAFFVDNPDQKFLWFQHLLGCIHSYSSPHSIWTRPWLGWKTLFVKLHTDTLLSAKFDNDISPFFKDNPDQKCFLFKKLLGCIYSYSSPHFTWTSFWLDLKTLFVKLHTGTLLRAKFDNDMSTFFVDNPGQ